MTGRPGPNPSTDGALLVLNAGSSSLKFCRYESGESPRVVTRGQIEGIGTSPQLRVKDGLGRSVADEPLEPADAGDVRSALAALRARDGGSPGEHLRAVGHRVVHGGSEYRDPVVVDDAVLERLRALVPLAPLHQPSNLIAIEAAREQFPCVPQIACFDTAFPRSIPEVAQLVPLPRELRETGLRRYGFHGLSYEYIASVLPEVAPRIATGRVVVAHLGNGASLCALRDGRSLDTTLGFTALDGLRTLRLARRRPGLQPAHRHLRPGAPGVERVRERGGGSVQRGDQWAQTARVTNNRTGTTTRATRTDSGAGAAAPRGNVTMDQLDRDSSARREGAQRTRDYGSYQRSGGSRSSAGSYRSSGSRGGGMRGGGRRR